MIKQKPSLTYIIIAILVLQTILMTGLLWRINTLYQKVTEDQLGVASSDIAMVFNVSADDDPSIGPDSAPVNIVEFSDFGCGHCRTMQETLNQIREKYDDKLRIVYRDFPIEGRSSGSFLAAQAAECANNQGAFWQMHDILFENQPFFDKGNLRIYASEIGLDMEQFESCIDSNDSATEIMQDREDGLSYGVSGTPTFFVNGRRLIGTVSLSTLERAVNDALGQE